MGSVTQDDLFDLIQSLDAAEKGHFSKYAQRHGSPDGNNYLHLFQMLARMTAYDAEYLMAELQRLGVVTPLAAAKNHLKTLLLRAMRDYNSDRNTHTRLLEGLENLAFLYEKKQYDLLRKELKRLKKIALMFGEYHILFKIGDYEGRLHKETARRDIVQGMEEILSEIQMQAQHFQNQLQFAHLLDKLFMIANKSGADRPQAVEALLDTPLLSSPAQAQTLLSQICYHQIHAMAYSLKGQHQAAKQAYIAVVQRWESAPHLIAEFPSRYRRILSNYLGICAETGDYSKFEALLDKVRNTPSRQPIDRAEIFSIGHNAELIWRMGTYNWEGVGAMIPSLQAGLQAHWHLLGQGKVLGFQYNIAVYYFLAEDYAACRKWLQQINDGPRTEQRMNIQRIAKVMGLLLIWIKGDLDLLEYELRSVTRYFENWGSGLLEDEVVSLIRGLLSAPEQRQQKIAYEHFRDRLVDPSMQALEGSLFLRAWAIGHLTSVSPQAVITVL
jgi:hypothetical protein